ncbi:hypothetical protein BC834DRAFT_973311 [Gloeopeniophorella convolvens]|nr:hypothetical protein BC834DRAFT_973311 [Gloeopeniophorella convolvens]
MCSRVLGHLILEAPTDAGRDWVCKKVLNCTDEPSLARLAQKYIFTFVGSFKASAGRSQSSTRASSISTPYEGASGLAHGDRRAQALLRDTYRCAVTGTFDAASARDPTVAADGYATSPGAPIATTEAALVIPPSVDMRILARYAGLAGDDPLCPPHSDFHRLENILTLDRAAAHRFSSLDLWLEATGRADEYQIVTWHPDILSPSRRRAAVAFTTTDPITRPIPSAEYLHLHAACARMAHKSGAATYLDVLAKDIALLAVLAEDGSSAGVLAAALSRIA